jgi:hypothetical protein
VANVSHGSWRLELICVGLIDRDGQAPYEACRQGR